MSYDIYLNDKKGNTIQLAYPEVKQMGTMKIGGETAAHVNITYNYSKYFYNYVDKEKGIRWLYGRTAKNTTDRLVKAIQSLKSDISDNYWEATEGNAKVALLYLLELALMYPDGIWDGD